MNNNIVQEIYSRNYGSVNFYHRNYYKSLIYTEGILDFQQTLKAYWFVDWVIVNMKNIIATYKANDDGFFVITIKFNKQKHCILEIFREGFVEGNYCKHITVIKEFHKYLLRVKEVRKDITLNLENIKVAKKIPNILNDHDLNLVLDVKTDNAFKYRDKAMLELMYGSGLRISELINLTIYSIDFDNNCVLIEGKGNKERIVPISVYSREALLNYLEVRSSLLKKKKEATDKLFLNNHGEGITRHGFNYILQNILKEKDIQVKVTPHSLRHTFATTLLNNGADLRSIQELLGHADIVTTRIYTHTQNNKLKNDYIKYNTRKEE